MARISLDLAHSYKPNPQQDSDYALLPLKMEFEDGGAYALLGPSGCGKTTMLNIMSGLLVPSHGKVLFDGRDVTRATPLGEVVAQLTGVHYFELGSAVTLYFDPSQIYVFASHGALMLAPQRTGGC